MRLRLRLVLFVLAMATVACRDGAARSDVAGQSDAVEAPPPSAPTGIASLDYTVNAALAHDGVELAGETGYAHVACKAEPVAGDAPACDLGEANGSIVEVLPVSGCANSWTRPRDVPDTYLFALGPSTTLLTIYRPKVTPQTFGGGFGAEYVAVIQTGVLDGGAPRIVGLHIAGGRVVWLEGDCSDASRLVSPERVDSYIVEPTALTP